MSKRLGILVALLLVAALTAACGGGGGGTSTQSNTSAPAAGGEVQRIEVSGSDFAFSPPDVTVKRGTTVELVFTNTGRVAHDWVAQGIEGAKTAAVRPGQNQTITFTPNQSGEYKIVCTEPGHEAAGMVGKLVVQ